MASISASVVTLSPGNVASIVTTGFTDGAATVSVDSQGATQGTSTMISGTLATANSVQTLSFTMPDGLASGNATVTDSASHTATFPLRVESQYLQGAEYIGEGIDTSDFAAGELDTVLRRASTYADAFMGGSKRLFQYLERHKYRKSRWIYPFKTPIVSVDQLTLVSSNQIKTNFNVSTDIYIASSGPSSLGPNNMQVLAYAMGNYLLLGALETIGFSANYWELTLTAGWPLLKYPNELREATTMIATELLTYRGIQAKGLGGLSRVRHGDQQYDRRQEPFVIPEPAKELLRPMVSRRMA